MFNFWDPQTAELYAGMMKPHSDLMRMWASGPAPQPPPPIAQGFGQFNQFDSAFRSFFEALQTQGMGALGSNYFDNLMKASSFYPTPSTAQFNYPFGQMPQVPAMPSLPPFQPNAFTMPTLDKSPALGITREWQEDIAMLMKLQQEAATRQQEFIKLFANFSASVGERVRSALDDVDLDELSFDQLCRIWIDCSEQEFQIIASSKQYSIAYAAMLNASMRLRQHSDTMLENSARLQNLPTRKEIDALHQSCTRAKERETELLRRISQLEEEVSRLSKPAANARRASTARKNRKRTSGD